LKERIKIKPSCHLIQGVKFRHPGSSYEHVAVTEKTDFDIAMVLPKPFNGDNFEVVGVRHGPGVYKLKWSKDEERPDFINPNGYLESLALRDKVFEQLNEIIKEVKKVRRQDWNIQNKNYNASICCIIKEHNEDFNIKIDLVPQMQVSRWDRTPAPPSKGQLPSVLRDYVDRTDYPMFFSLAGPAKTPDDNDGYAAPHQLKRENYKHLLVTCSFSELEKHCLKSSKVVCNAVRLVKLVSLEKEWKKTFNLHSFHIKRVAIKHYDTLDKLSD
ncbi:unnamed protein product, partial [Meganyctiphanes norvegica]